MIKSIFKNIVYTLSFSLSLGISSMSSAEDTQTFTTQLNQTKNITNTNTVAYLSLNNKQHIATDFALLHQYLDYFLPKIERIQQSFEQLPKNATASQTKIKVKAMQRLVEKTNVQLDALPIQSREIFSIIQLLKKSNNLGLGISQEALNSPIDLGKVNQMIEQTTLIQSQITNQIKDLKLNSN